jgi:IS605 OrfB family transposase
MLNSLTSINIPSGSLLKVKKTIKAKILENIHPSKLALLSREYYAFQSYIRGNKSVNLYSATKQQAERFLKRIKEPKDKPYPLIIRNDLIDIQRDDKGNYWAKIPVYPGSINIPIKPHIDIDPSWKIRETKLLKRIRGWFLYITVEKEVEEKKQYDCIIPIDMGNHNTVTSIINKPIFMGKEVREARGWFYHLRRHLLRTRRAVKRFGSKEKRVVNYWLHKYSNAIVQEAFKHNGLIVLGNLKGIRKNHGSRSYNRRLSSFPFYKLSQYIIYKANWLGLKVLKISEAWTSQTCAECGHKGIRERGRFLCSNPYCGVERNADYNACLNIKKRALGYISRVGARLGIALNLGMVK